MLFTASHLHLWMKGCQSLNIAVCPHSICLMQSTAWGLLLLNKSRALSVLQQGCVLCCVRAEGSMFMVSAGVIVAGRAWNAMSLNTTVRTQRAVVTASVAADSVCARRASLDPTVVKVCKKMASVFDCVCVFLCVMWLLVNFLGWGTNCWCLHVSLGSSLHIVDVAPCVYQACVFFSLVVFIGLFRSAVFTSHVFSHSAFP